MFMSKRKIINNLKITNPKGIITIFLCMILVPILGLSGALIEFGRYQGDIQNAREVGDVATTSTLAHYDDYINKRFGLFSMDQEKSPAKIEKKYLKNNMGIMGKSSSLLETKIEGNCPLTYDSNKILRQQIEDFSETTVLTNGILKDLNLEEILKKLDDIPAITQIADIADKYKDAAQAAKDTVDLWDKLKEAKKAYKQLIKDYENAVESARKKTNKLKNAIRKDDKLKFEHNYDVVSLKDVKDKDKKDEELRDYLLKEYKGKIKNSVTDVFKARSLLNDSIVNKAKEIISKAKELNSSITKLRTKVRKAQTINSSLGNSSPKDIFLDSTEKLRNDTSGVLDKINDDMAAKIQKRIDTLVERYDDQFKISILCPYGYYSMLREARSAFALIVTQGKYDFEQLKPGDSLNVLSNINLGSAFKDFSDVVVDNLKKAASEFFKAVCKAIKNLFNINIGFDGDLSAVLSDEIAKKTSASDQNNPYVTLLEAISSYLKAIKKLTSPKGLLDWLSGVVEYLKALVKVLQTGWNLIKKIVSNISRLCGYLSGNYQKLYEDLLLYGYAAHNFPNKNTYDNGTALTGYDFEKIKYQRDSKNQTPSIISTFTGLGTTINNLATTGGKDKMFCGAELEYLMVGTKSELMNQLVVFMQIYVMRLVLDIIPVFCDLDLQAAAPPDVIVRAGFYATILFAEPFIDTLVVTNGGKSPLIKGDVYLSPTGMLSAVTDIASAGANDKDVRKKLKDKIDGLKKEIDPDELLKEGKGHFYMEYDMHCLVTMFLTCSPQDVLNRISDLVYLESKSYYKAKDKKFSMEKTYTAVKTKMELMFNPFMDVLSSGKSSIFTKEFVIQRGY